MHLRKIRRSSYSKSSRHCTVIQSSQCAERALSLLLGISTNAFFRLGGAPDRLALWVHSERSSDCSLKGSGYSYGSTTYSDEKYRFYRSKLMLPVHLRGSYCAEFFSVPMGMKLFQHGRRWHPRRERCDSSKKRKSVQHLLKTARTNQSFPLFHKSSFLAFRVK